MTVLQLGTHIAAVAALWEREGLLLHSQLRVLSHDQAHLPVHSVHPSCTLPLSFAMHTHAGGAMQPLLSTWRHSSWRPV